MHRNYSPLLLLLLLLFSSPNGMPPLIEMDPDTLPTTNRLAGHHLHHPIHPHRRRMP